jgi:uncharacterized protein YkwD
LLIRLLPLLLLTLTLGCLVGASGEEGTSIDGTPEGASRSAGSQQASSALVLIATVTPVPGQGTSRLSVLPSPTAAATATATYTATATAEAAETLIAVLPTETPADVQATEAPTQVPTETPTATESPTPTETATPSPTPTRTPSPTPVTPTIVPIDGLSAAETQILIDHNKVRSQNGLPQFRTNATLVAIARERAETMASTGNLSHTNLDGTNVFDMMDAYGYAYVTGSENIHYNYGYSDQQSVKVAMNEWINSAPHHASIVNPNLGRIGIGVATASNGYVYYSVVFSD